MDSSERFVQYAVTTLILVAVAFFAFRHFRSPGTEGPLRVGSTVGLVKVRHVKNGQSPFRGEASESSGGKLALGPSGFRLSWMLGVKETEISYSLIESYRTEQFGLTRILILEIRGEDRFWALWVRRSEASLLTAFLDSRSGELGQEVRER